MISVFGLRHPQSPFILKDGGGKYATYKWIACGMASPAECAKTGPVDYSEANDFLPNYASWNSALFESSVILTIRAHIDELCRTDYIAIVHSDIERRSTSSWKSVHELLEQGKTVGLSVSNHYKGFWKKFQVQSTIPFQSKNDPMLKHQFDFGTNIWDYIKELDYDAYLWAIANNPIMTYTHQFACSVTTYKRLGDYLLKIADNLRLQDVGLWTPHVFERLIAIKLAMLSDVVLTTAFWHVGSSSSVGGGELLLYGARPRRYLKIKK